MSPLIMIHDQALVMLTPLPDTSAVSPPLTRTRHVVAVRVAVTMNHEFDRRSDAE